MGRKGRRGAKPLNRHGMFGRITARMSCAFRRLEPIGAERLFFSKLFLTREGQPPTKGTPRDGAAAAPRSLKTESYSRDRYRGSLSPRRLATLMWRMVGGDNEQRCKI